LHEMLETFERCFIVVLICGIIHVSHKFSVVLSNLGCNRKKKARDPQSKGKQ
jgi:hypothetical protein